MRRLRLLIFATPLMSAIACRETTSAPSTPTNRVSSVAENLAVNLSGSLVYTIGTIHVYNLATHTDVNLGVTGVNPKFSPNGTLITYQGGGGISVMNSNGTNSRLLNASGGVPSFSPTGTTIAYSDGGIWKINVDGTGRTQLTTDGGHWPAWSPDGTQIAYGATAGKIQQLFIMNADGSNRHQALTSGGITDIVWQPSSRILFAISNGNYDLYSYDPASPSSLTRLTTSKDSDFEPSWSPDGTQISWTSGTSGRTSGIWTMNADGTNKQGPVIAKGRQGSWGL